jgi:SAM-dependent methyltransferase
MKTEHAPTAPGGGNQGSWKGRSCPMNRVTWLAERRAAVVASYDTEAATYDQLEYPRATHAAWLARLLERCPPNALMLDAPCGTGRYFAQVAAAGHRVAGIDQSAGMLAQARARGIASWLAQVALQQLAYPRQFDAILTIDALENVPPEDWPRVLANLHRALKPEGLLYLTVEDGPEAIVEAAYAQSVARGLPVVRGELVDGNVAGYHYYPGRERVLSWLAAEGLRVAEEAYQPEAGWGYWHLLVRG